MRILVYKRTHIGDPDESGCFGIHSCMGQVRERDLDAVIGVGGVGSEPVQEGIDKKLTWIGIGPKRVGVADDGHPLLAFEQFYLKDEKGPLLGDKAPKLAKRMFAENGPRSVMVDADDEMKSILQLAKRAQPSPALLEQVPKRKGCNRGKKKSC